MSKPRSIGIYKAIDNSVGFYQFDMAAMFNDVIKETSKILGNTPEKKVCSLEDSPEAGTCAKRVGEIIVRSVEDDEVYTVERDEEDDVNKPDVNRKPDAKPGTWIIQSVIFDKARFESVDDCKAWLSDADNLGDYGYDETENSYRYRQYNPDHFSDFRTGTLTEGVSVVYGKVKQASDTEAGDEDAEKSADTCRIAIEGMWAINKGIISRGIKLLNKTAEIRKAKNGGEERFIMGLVLEPNDGAPDAPLKPDTQEDVYSAEDVRKTAHGWMENYGQIDLMHSWKALDKEEVRPLETYVTPVAFTIGEGDDTYDVVKGSWLLGLRVVNDELWKAVQDSKIGAYSIGGTAERAPEADASGSSQ